MRLLTPVAVSLRETKAATPRMPHRPPAQAILPRKTQAEVYMHYCTLNVAGCQALILLPEALGCISAFATSGSLTKTSIGDSQESRLRWRSLAGAGDDSSSGTIRHGSGTEPVIQELQRLFSETAELAVESDPAFKDAQRTPHYFKIEETAHRIARQM